jgi:hypothetical protein
MVKASLMLTSHCSLTTASTLLVATMCTDQHEGLRRIQLRNSNIGPNKRWCWIEERKIRWIHNRIKEKSPSMPPPSILSAAMDRRGHIQKKNSQPQSGFIGKRELLTWIRTFVPLTSGQVHLHRDHRWQALHPRVPT